MSEPRTDRGEPPIDTRHRPNALSPTGFVLAFGAVSMLADVVYEGARAIVGPYLATLGASAALVGFVTGAGEAVALVLRLATGPLADKTRRYWAWSIAGYVTTVAAVPLLSFSATLTQASALVIAERFGKAVRTPARDTMLSHAGGRAQRGRVFALHEMLDRTGALLGPLVVALMIAIDDFRAAFRVLLIPGLAALGLLAWLRRKVPRPQDYEQEALGPQPPAARAEAAASVPAPLPGLFWRYSLFTALSMLGFTTFGVIAYHLQVRHVLAPDVIPLLYAAAMAAAGGWRCGGRPRLRSYRAAQRDHRAAAHRGDSSAVLFHRASAGLVRGRGVGRGGRPAWLDDARGSGRSGACGAPRTGVRGFQRRLRSGLAGRRDADRRALCAIPGRGRAAGGSHAGARLRGVRALVAARPRRSAAGMISTPAGSPRRHPLGPQSARRGR